MASTSSTLFHRLVVDPGGLFEELRSTEPDALLIFFRYLIWFALLPPVFAYIGASNFGWRLGAEEPLYIPTANLVMVSIGYFITLLFGFVSTALMSQWMAPTYGARESFGVHLMLVVIIAVPMIIGSAAHLFPHAFLNILLLMPMLIWSMYLLYKGLPVILDTTPEQGMLMASSLIGYVLVGVVSLLGISVALWGAGVGPSIGV